MDQQLIDNFKDNLLKQILKEWQNQGHYLTGSFEDNIEITDEKEIDSLLVKVITPLYGAYVDGGVNSNRIPYSPGSGAKKSAYIDALTRYLERRMSLSGKEAVSAAFAIAKTHKKHGMPSPGSYKYAPNNRRTQWVDNVLAESSNMIYKFANELSDSIIEVTINKWQ